MLAKVFWCRSCQHPWDLRLKRNPSCVSTIFVLIFALCVSVCLFPKLFSYSLMISSRSSAPNWGCFQPKGFVFFFTPLKRCFEILGIRRQFWEMRVGFFGSVVPTSVQTQTSLVQALHLHMVVPDPVTHAFFVFRWSSNRIRSFLSLFLAFSKFSAGWPYVDALCLVCRLVSGSAVNTKEWVIRIFRKLEERARILLYCGTA